MSLSVSFLLSVLHPHHSFRTSNTSSLSPSSESSNPLKSLYELFFFQFFNELKPSGFSLNHIFLERLSQTLLTYIGFSYYHLSSLYIALPFIHRFVFTCNYLAMCVFGLSDGSDFTLCRWKDPGKGDRASLACSRVHSTLPVPRPGIEMSVNSS